MTEIHVRVYCDACGRVYTDPGIVPEQFEPEDLGACFRSRALAVDWFTGCPQGWVYDGDRVLCDACRAVERHELDTTDLYTED
ncbi:hypothetical protein [Nocardia sp. NPDC005366]|uniref:hypothetical protein n=1 Tax=Nocardia sp. NPDC005366 TaxID=3156878 RepID=UPI0033B1C72E